MNLRTAGAALAAVVAVFVALGLGAIVLLATALTQSDTLHQILLIGLGFILIASGMVLLASAVSTYIRERNAARRRLER